ncbi:MAG TPA: ATP-binding protein [Ignavibacteriaceae bacterium]|nr:ATP-binding protein [Ignavibacteriaceae bacterium]
MSQFKNSQIDIIEKYGLSNVPSDIIAAAFNNAQVIVYSYSLSLQRILFVSKAVESILGVDIESILSPQSKLLKLVSREDLPRVKEFLRSLKNGEKSSVEYSVYDNNKNLVNLKHSAFPVFEKNHLDRIDGVIYDISAEKKAFNSLHQSEKRFRSIFDSSEELIFIIDHHLMITSINNHGALLLAYTPSEMIGKSILSFISESYTSEISSLLSDFETKPLPGKIIWIFKDKFDNEIPIEVSLKSDSSDPESFLIGLGHDSARYLDMEYEILELKAKIDELNQIITVERNRKNSDDSFLHELNKIRNEFISNVSHEFRTPLASIIGFAETIDSDNDMPDETRSEFNKIILAEAKRLANLINDILNFSKMESGEIILHKEKASVNELLQNVVNSIQRKIEKKSIHLLTEFSPENIFFFGDKKWIEVVFENILENSIKFTPTQGKISVSLKGTASFAAIIISDTGAGIPANEIPYLFDKFFKGSKYSNEPGTGLGLCISKQILDLHNAHISIESKVNIGTSVFINIPRVINGKE